MVKNGHSLADAAERAWSLLEAPEMQTGWQGVSQDYAGNKLILASLLATGMDDQFFAFADMGRTIVPYGDYVRKTLDAPFARKILPHADHRYEFADAVMSIGPIASFDSVTRSLGDIISETAARKSISSTTRQTVRSLLARSTFLAYGAQQVFKEGWHVPEYAPVRGAPPGPLSIAGYDADYARHVSEKEPSATFRTYEDHLRSRLSRLADGDGIATELLRKDFARTVQDESRELRLLLDNRAHGDAVRERYTRVRQAFLGWYEGTKLTRTERKTVTP